MTEITSSSQHSHSDSFTVQYDRLDDEPLSVTVANAVAAFTNRDATELEPLHYAIDGDALERLFEPRADGLRSGGVVKFAYNDCFVTVTAEGEITVESVPE